MCLFLLNEGIYQNVRVAHTIFYFYFLYFFLSEINISHKQRINEIILKMSLMWLMPNCIL